MDIECDPENGLCYCEPGYTYPYCNQSRSRALPQTCCHTYVVYTSSRSNEKNFLKLDLLQVDLSQVLLRTLKKASEASFNEVAQRIREVDLFRLTEYESYKFTREK